MDEQARQREMKNRSVFYGVRAMRGVSISKHAVIEALAWAMAVAVVMGLAWLVNK